MKWKLGLVLVVLASYLFVRFQTHLDRLNDVSGGTIVAISVAVLPFFSPFLHVKDALFSDEMEGAVVKLLSPFLVPRGDDATHAALEADPPDFANEYLAWASLPHVRDTADAIPPLCGDGRPCEAENQGEAKVDLFFVGPSTHYSAFAWNSDWRDEMTRFMNREAIVPQQAAIFNHVARVYFPQSRQMTGMGYLAPRDSPFAQRASELAYSDVRRAFHYYLENFNPQGSRPFFISGHSQGSEYLLRLLKEEIAPKPELKSRLIAAYLVGMPVYKHMLREMGIPVCSSPTQTGCVISWQTYVEGASPRHFFFEPVHKPLRFPAGATEEEKFADRVCVNPLSWEADQETYVSREKNKGAMHLVQWMQNVHFLNSWRLAGSPVDRQMDRTTTVLPLKKNMVGARCVNGSLWVDTPPAGERGSNPLYSFFPVWRFAMFPGSNLHPYDYNLFWENVRDNVALRTQAFLAAQKD